MYAECLVSVHCQQVDEYNTCSWASQVTLESSKRIKKVPSLSGTLLTLK